MGDVVLDMSMSLDGFIAGPDDTDGGLHNWVFTPPHGMPPSDGRIVQEINQAMGALILGRRTYNQGVQVDAFRDNPHSVEHFVLTHHPPEHTAEGDTSFTFVTAGPDDALMQARRAAKGRDVYIGGGAENARQFLAAGLIDEIQIHLVPVVLGKGLRLFDNESLQRHQLEPDLVVESPNVTHLRYRLVPASPAERIR